MPFELYKSKVSNRFIYNGAQKLSMKIYELLIKEELTEHNRKTAMQALNMVRNDTTSCIQIIVDCIGIVVSGITMAGYAAVLIYVSRWVGVISSLVLLLLMAFVFLRTRARMIAYGEKSRACSIKANSQITIAYGSFKEMKIDDRSAFVLGKYRDASNEYAQVQGEYKYKVSSIGVILQNSIMAAMFVVLAVILVFGTNLAAVLAPMVVYITALVRMLPMAYGILSGMNNVEFARKSYEAVRGCMAGYTKMKETEEQNSHVRQKKLTFEKGVSVRNLTFGYNDRVKIFEDASIDIPVGCSIAIIGASGAGKTTILNILGGMDTLTSGKVFLDGQEVSSFGRRQLTSYRRYDVGFVFQFYNLVQNLTALENVELAAQICREPLDAAMVLEQVGLRERMNNFPAQLSGGEQQRVAIARALAKNPKLLLCDEPTGALDYNTGKAVLKLLQGTCREMGRTVIVITHNQALTAMADRVITVKSGTVADMTMNDNIVDVSEIEW